MSERKARRGSGSLAVGGRGGTVAVGDGGPDEFFQAVRRIVPQRESPPPQSLAVAAASSPGRLQTGQHRVQPDSFDPLHHVVVIAGILADAEHRHDVGVVQLGRRLGFAGEPLGRFRVGQELAGQHLDGHAAAQRHLLGLVDDSHAAPADLPHDPVVPEPLRGTRRSNFGQSLRHVPFRHLFDQLDGRQNTADFRGVLGVRQLVFRDGWRLAALQPFQKLVGEPIDQLVFGISHRLNPATPKSPPPLRETG